MKPVLLVIAGPNGSGKTTVTVRLRVDRWSEGVDRAKVAGYFVRVFFIGTSDPRINAARVAGRVMAGGHTVPIEKIISRYGRSMANLAGAIDIADRVYIYDNSIDDVEARLCARYDGRSASKGIWPIARVGRRRDARSAPPSAVCGFA